MSKARLLLLSLVAVLSVAGVSASTASAKISFEWFVGGSLLKEKETRAFDTNNDGKTFDFHGTLAGISVLLLAKKIRAEGGIIIGGRPGTNEETLVFEEVTADKAGCTVESRGSATGTVRTSLLKTEIVEGENGEVLILFVPKVQPFTTLLLLGASCVGANIPAEVTGEILGLSLPQRTEVLRQNIVFPSKEQNFFLASGVLNTSSGLSFGGNAATLEGLALFLLTNDLAFGPF
jgi:hypothetical protein